jgi:hypothetical protein
MRRWVCFNQAAQSAAQNKAREKLIVNNAGNSLRAAEKIA